MAYEKKEAEFIIFNELQSVDSHIAKIWVHSPSSWDEKWKGDMADYLFKVIRVANNLKPGKKKLQTRVLEEKLENCFDLAAAGCAKTYSSDKFKELKKSAAKPKVIKAAREIMFPSLCTLKGKLTKLILLDDEEQSVVIADAIGDLVIKTRNEYFKL